MQDAGQYICNLYCPIKKTETDNTVFSDTLSRVVSFGGLKEFADFDIVFDTSIMSPEVKEAFKIDSSTTDKVIDPFDLTPYWLTSFTYSFDTSKMKPTIEYEYQSFYLFKLAIHDRWVEKPDEYIG
ncbi:MAG: hypothetical protein MJ200_04115 [Mycoplasmoidaceae bacterium]|nr:hypothetical protein [Mycoplasmoidaceae bacterium]